MIVEKYIIEPKLEKAPMAKVATGRIDKDKNEAAMWKEIKEFAISQNYTNAEWERKKKLLYITLKNCLDQFGN